MDQRPASTRPTPYRPIGVRPPRLTPHSGGVTCWSEWMSVQPGQLRAVQPLAYRRARHRPNGAALTPALNTPRLAALRGPSGDARRPPPGPQTDYTGPRALPAAVHDEDIAVQRPDPAAPAGRRKASDSVPRTGRIAKRAERVGGIRSAVVGVAGRPRIDPDENTRDPLSAPRGSVARLTTRKSGRQLYVFTPPGPEPERRSRRASGCRVAT